MPSFANYKSSYKVNRRHIRVKVMQSIYAMHQNGSDNLEEEKFLFIVSTTFKTYTLQWFLP
jgi:hypothetical protein